MVDDNKAVAAERRPETVLTPAEAALHNNLVVSLEDLRKGVVRTAYYLLQIRERLVYRKLGFASLSEYAAQHAGFTARQTEEYVALGRRLPQYPEVERALSEGRLSWSHARLIVRRADPEEQRAWVEQAGAMTSRELEIALPARGIVRSEVAPSPDADLAEATVGGQKNMVPAERPIGHRTMGPTAQPASMRNEVPTPPEVIHVTCTFTGEQYALFERLLSASGGGRKEERILQALASDEIGGRSLPHLLVILQCPDCGKGVIPSSRGDVQADVALLGAARCHAKIEDPDGRRRNAVAPRHRRLALRRARFRCEADGCLHTLFLEIHHRIPASVGGGDGLENLIVLCSSCHRRLHEDEQEARRALRDAP